MSSAKALDAKFGIGDLVRVAERDGHPIIVVRTAAASADIALQGAQVLSWTPAGNTDVFWCAPLPAPNSGKAIRGGIPICWPWFGPHATDAGQPQHGLVRTANWTLTEARATPDGAYIALAHTAFGCALRVEMDLGRQLTLRLTATNQSAAAVTITEALHTYFSVSDAHTAKVHGLDGLIFRDNTDGARETLQAGDVALAAETIAVFPDTPNDVELRDSGFGRAIRIARAGGRSTIVWHPGASVSTFKDIPADQATRFVCVESGNVAPHAITLAPSAMHQLSVRYEIARL